VLFRSVVLGAFAPPALAAPAVIKVFEAKAREAPADDAPVLATLPEDAKVSVSEEVTDGWRRVRLAEGRVAFIHDAEVTVETARPVPAPQPMPAPVRPLVRERPPRSPEAPLIYVKDVHHLAELVQTDDVVFPKANALARRRTAGYGAMLASIPVGVLLMTLGATVFSHEECYGGSFCEKKSNIPLVISGLLVIGAGEFLGMAMLPTPSDLIDVVNLWNERHVNRPITLER